jgi:hypothetical protein
MLNGAAFVADTGSISHLLDACQQSEAIARGFLRIQVALSFVLDLQAGPFIRIDSLEIGSLELAIGDGAAATAAPGRQPDFWFGISNWFGVSTGAHGSPGGDALPSCSAGPTSTLRRMARASGK